MKKQRTDKKSSPKDLFAVADDKHARKTHDFYQKTMRYMTTHQKKPIVLATLCAKRMEEALKNGDAITMTSEQVSKDVRKKFKLHASEEQRVEATRILNQAWRYKDEFTAVHDTGLIL